MNRFPKGIRAANWSRLSHRISLLTGILLLAAGVPALADFEVATTDRPETRPAVAFNSQTSEFFVAYLERGRFPDSPFELRVQRYDRRGAPQGGVIQPLGSDNHEALGRPAIEYGANDNVMLVAVPVKKDTTSDRVAARFLAPDGTNVGAPVLFDDELGVYHETHGYGALQITYNPILDEFVLTVQHTVGGDVFVSAQKLSLGSLGPVVTLHGSSSTHDLNFAAVPTTPAGGRYLFISTGGFFEAHRVLDAELNTVTGFEINRGFPSPDGSIEQLNVGFGRVEGQDRWLEVWVDPDNCAPGTGGNFEPECLPWTGIWGTYIDPLDPDTGNNTPFPISRIEEHVVGQGHNHMPRVGYNHDAETFYVVWREVPGQNDLNDESRSHIRGNRIDFFVEDGLWSSSSVPEPHDNVVLSDVTGGSCVPGVACLSNEDPVFPDVSANDGFGAVVVWESKSASNPLNLDIIGEFMSPPVPDNDTIISPVVILPNDPPTEGTLIGSFNDGIATCGFSSQNPDVWFLFEAPADGTLRVDTCGSNDLYGEDTGMDTVLSLHDSAGVQLGVETCSDDWPGTVAGACESNDAGSRRDSALELAVAAGQAVLARVSRYGNSVGGQFVLNLGFEALTGLEFYSDGASFHAANPNLAVEDFEAGNIGFAFGSPLDSTSDNDAFGPGDILPGVAFYNDPDDTLGIVDGTNYPGMTSKTLLKSSESPPGGAGALDMVFSGNGVYSVGLDLYHTTGGSTGLIAAETTILVFGTSGLLDSAVVTTAVDGPVFFGVRSEFEPITGINVDGVVPGFYSFEGIDNVAFNGDSDADGVADEADNCIAVPNADQRDVDSDGHGSLCDADFNNDCTINFVDLGFMRSGFFGSDPELDLDGDGTVNFGDLGIVRGLFFGPPGPSAAGICTP